MLQTARFDGSVLEVMQGANKVLTQINAKVNMDKIDDLRDDMAENQAHADEVGEMFAEAVNDDKDELAAELDEMMATDMMGDMIVTNKVIDGVMPIPAPVPVVPVA